jgi:hypothetical protein
VADSFADLRVHHSCGKVSQKMISDSDDSQRPLLADHLHHRQQQRPHGRGASFSINQMVTNTDREPDQSEHQNEPSKGDSNGLEDDPSVAKRPSVLYGSAGYIILTEFCERLAYNSLAGSLILFFQTQLRYSNAEADIQYSLWSGICYVMPLIGGYVADTYWGRYTTILVSASCEPHECQFTCNPCFVRYSLLCTCWV